jgi:hypothetical protein
VGNGAWDVDAVGLRRGTEGSWQKDLPVLRLAGLEPLPGGLPDLGPIAADGHRLPGRRCKKVRRGADLRLDGQREDGDHHPRRRAPGKEPADGRGGTPLRHHGSHLRAGGPREQGRIGGHGQDRQGRPGAHRGQSAPGTRASPSSRKPARVGARRSTSVPTARRESPRPCC